MEKARALVEAFEALRDRLKINLLLVVTDQSELVDLCLQRSPVPVILATSDEGLRRRYAGKVKASLPFPGGVRSTVSALNQLNDLLLQTYLEGALQLSDNVLVLASHGEAIDAIVVFDVDKDLELARLRSQLEDSANLKVVERVIALASELAREGREGHRVGAIFVVGDSGKVLEHSRPLVINPFAGHPEKERNILQDKNWETAKEFSRLDGAFVVRSDGVIEAAGRYLETDKGIELPSGLGGRHLAAASITKKTNSVAVTVSTSGVIRVFRDGRIVVVLGRHA
ncbi:MAG TPA: diadenylate cyclase [Candidatus Thermoplasmatota archaeon]|jgi:DNA integrity scanning protein DisA with diadenylate cyclase activity|nr:diadenylate cyclase [Candidatus Thermoplasmatota archaeon]